MEARVIWVYLYAGYRMLTSRDEEGSVVEKVILTAIFAGMAIAAGVVIYNKVSGKVNSLDLNSPGTSVP